MPSSPQPPHSDQRHQQDQLLIDTLSPRAVLRFGEPYLTGHELDDSGGDNANNNSDSAISKRY